MAQATVSYYSLRFKKLFLALYFTPDMDGKEDDIFLCVCMRKILQFSVLLFQQIIVSLLLKKVSSHSPYTGFPQSNPGLRVSPKPTRAPMLRASHALFSTTAPAMLRKALALFR